MEKYTVTRYLNSEGSKRRGEHIEQLRKGMIPHVVTLQFHRCGDNYEEGQPLPHMHSPDELRSVRSKYVPHVGAKQKLKQTRRMFRDPKVALALHA